jgi:predicted nucleic acid-binding protein
VKVLVFDNTPLSHFARANSLGVLERLTSGFRRVAPAEVIRELIAGVPQHPSLSAAIGLPWLEIVELDEVAEVVAFARYKAELGGGVERNNGESAVLAWSSVHGAVALIDERAGTRCARRDNIEVHGTMWLITNAFRDGLLTKPAATKMVDLLAATDMALPTDGAGFFTWAHEEGLLP